MRLKSYDELARAENDYDSHLREALKGCVEKLNALRPRLEAFSGDPRSMEMKSIIVEVFSPKFPFGERLPEDQLRAFKVMQELISARLLPFNPREVRDNLILTLKNEVVMLEIYHAIVDLLDAEKGLGGDLEKAELAVVNASRKRIRQKKILKELSTNS